eukprot:GFUD01029584.1.p1 GENE.GFUD01029584.1~~GFUD01029584.1.p1  ORF type:complete len:171 (-),score=46.66 GFUD01029584.1:388-900(-)
MHVSNYRSLVTLVQRTVGTTRNLSGKTLPRNLEELGQSHMGRTDQVVGQTRQVTARELEVSQSSRVFGSGFLTHQGAGMDLQTGEMIDQVDMMEQVTRNQDSRVELYQQNNVSMILKTNVPEPFQAEEDTSEELKEGVPVGLSDSQVNLEARSNMDCRLELKVNSMFILE